MIRRIFLVVAGIALAGTAFPSFAPSVASAAFDNGTQVLGGTMSSAAVISMTGALSVGRLTDLNWELPRPTSMWLNGFSERIERVWYRFNVAPNWAADRTVNGIPVRRFHWDAPPAHTVIRVTETFRLEVVTRLTPFHSPARYPLVSVPKRVAPYLKLTPMLRLYGHGHRLARRLAARARTEQAVVVAVANYVASHIHYSADASLPYRAAWVLVHYEAECQGYANAMAALLRYEGIPAQAEYGWVSSAPVRLPGPNHDTTLLLWSQLGSRGAAHVWLNIYFPHTGWVPFDPQREKFFIDPRHIGLFSNVDAGSWIIGRWSALAVVGARPTIANLPTGTDEIVPGASPSQVTVSSRDNFRVTFRSIRHDVSNVLLFSR